MLLILRNINVVDVVVVRNVVVEIVENFIAVIDNITERIMFADITVFVRINVVDVVRMFTIVVDIFRVCIMKNIQLTKFSSQLEVFL